MKNTAVTNFFAFIMIVIGIILIYCNFDIDNNIDVNCKSDVVRKVNKGILISGMLLITFSLAVLTFPMFCGSNSGEKTEVGSEFINFYACLTFLVSIYLISSFAIIKNNDNEDCAGKATSPTAIIILGSFLMASSGLILTYNLYPKKKAQQQSRSLLRPPPTANFPKTSRA